MPDLIFAEGTDRVARILERTAARVGPEGMLELNTILAGELEEYFDKNWPMGVAADLPQTADRWPESSLLENSGALRASLAEKTQNSVRVITPYELQFGTSLFYGRFINDGTRKMRPRPFMKVTGKLRALVIETVKTYVGFSPDLRFKSGFRI